MPARPRQHAICAYGLPFAPQRRQSSGMRLSDLEAACAHRPFLPPRHGLGTSAHVLRPHGHEKCSTHICKDAQSTRHPPQRGTSGHRQSLEHRGGVEGEGKSKGEDDLRECTAHFERDRRRSKGQRRQPLRGTRRSCLRSRALGEGEGRAGCKHVRKLSAQVTGRVKVRVQEMEKVDRSVGWRTISSTAMVFEGPRPMVRRTAAESSAAAAPLATPRPCCTKDPQALPAGQCMAGVAGAERGECDEGEGSG